MIALATPRDRAASPRERLARSVARLIAGRDLPVLPERGGLAAVSAQVDDSGGWHAFEGGPNDRDASEILQQYGYGGPILAKVPNLRKDSGRTDP